MKTIVLLAILVALTIATPYETLELKDGAKIQEAAYNFKKFALRYHPDRLIDPVKGIENLSVEEKKTKFFEIASAYSEIKTGSPLEESLKKDLNENYSDFFFQFFSDGVCALEKDGNNKQCEGEKKPTNPNPFEDTETVILNMQTIGDYFKREESWVIICFKNKNESDSMIKTYQKLSKKNKDMFRVGSVECSLENEICDELFNAKDKDYESMIAPASATGDFQSLTGYVTSVKNIAGMAFKQINDIKVEELYQQNYNVLTAKASKDKKKFGVFFTEKNNTPKTFKLIASKVDPYFTFTSVSSVNKKMVEKFGIKEFPALVILHDPRNINTAYSYEGEIKKSEIVKFLLENKDPVESKFSELTQDLIESGKYCTSKDSYICLIFALQNNIEELEKVKDIPKEFSKNPVRFFYVKSGLSEEFEGEPGFVLIRSKRQRYALSKAADIGLDRFVNSALEGSANFKNMPEGFLDSIYGQKQEQKKDDL